MKKLVLGLAAVVAFTTFAREDIHHFNLDYSNYTKTMWCCNAPDIQTRPADMCVQQFRGDFIRGESANVHGLILGIGQSRVKGSLLGGQLTMVMSKIDGDVLGICGAIASRVDGKMMGLQGGCATRCTILQNGVQYGYANDTDESRGLQLGLVNHAKKGYRKGIQIGLINFCDNSKFPIFPFVNGAWVFGEAE